MMETEHAKHLPVFWGHGTADPVVQYQWGVASVDKLRGMGYEGIQFESYPVSQESFFMIDVVC